jgi:ring-1,2-phenylacetyl-CoA epoxidase subunit PaaC
MKKEEALALHLADNNLILGQRLSEWCGHGPVLEEDIALSNMALDYIGQATLLFKHLAEASGDTKTEDDWAFLRDAWDYKNFLALELPNGDYAFTIARQYLYSEWYNLYLIELSKSSNTFLQEFALKSVKEVRYHLQHGRDWVLRMGDGTEESHARIQKAVNDIWSYTGEWFIPNANDTDLSSTGICPNVESLHQTWMENVQATLNEATLQMPVSGWMHKGGREGKHTEHLGHLLSEMQFLQRTYPNSKW